jgi:hypothetical protein
VAVDPPVVKAIDALLEERGFKMRLGDGEVQA